MSTIKNIQNNLIPTSEKPVNNVKDPKMMEAAKSFENQLLRQMVTEMRKTIPKDEEMPETMAESLYRDRLDDEYTDSWVDKGGIGIADLIYNQLQEKYSRPTEFRKPSGEFIPLPPTSPSGRSSSPPQMPQDILSKADKGLFLAKKLDGGFDIKSREPLPESVDLRSPLSGVVLQAATLEDGRNVIVIQHDQGLVSQLVHSGVNSVKTKMRVTAGEPIAKLPASRQGELANVFFGLRKASKLE